MPFDSAFSSLSSVSGLPHDQLRFVACLLAAYPISFLYRKLSLHLPSGFPIWLRHLYCLVPGLFFAWVCYGSSAVHAVISSTACYLVMKFAGPHRCHSWVFILAMLYLSASHIYRLYVDYMGWSLDFSTTQMLLTLKLTQLAYNYHDGHTSPDKLYDYNKKKMVKNLPSLLEFYGYVFAFFGLLGGPVFEYSDYLDFIDLKMYTKETTSSRNNSSSSAKKISTLVPTLSKLGSALLCVFVTLFIASRFPSEYMRSSEFLSEKSLLFRLFYCQISAAVQRFKYYFGWFMSEGSAIAAGIAFNGYDERGNPRWDRLTNAVVSRVELAENVKSITDNWNIATSQWLKHYVYLRLTPPGSKPTHFATIATYLVSAFWHGFYPGYYFFFFMSAITTISGRYLRRNVRPLFMKDAKTGKYPLKYLYDFAGVFMLSMCLNNCSATFFLLDLWGGLRVWHSTYYLCQIAIVLPIVVFTFMPLGHIQHKKEHRPDVPKQGPSLIHAD